MPWCETCSRFYNPNSLEPDGTCPQCGREVLDPKGEAEPQHTPWHFKLLVAVTVIYLGWRAVQLVTMVVS